MKMDNVCKYIILKNLVPMLQVQAGVLLEKYLLQEEQYLVEVECKKNEKRSLHINFQRNRRNFAFSSPFI
jgi:hypothetical protein